MDHLSLFGKFNIKRADETAVIQAPLNIAVTHL